VIIEVIIAIVILHEHACDVREHRGVRNMMLALAAAIGLLGRVKEDRWGCWWLLHEILDEEFLWCGGHGDQW
jgi:hypothetical protein